MEPSESSQQSAHSGNGKKPRVLVLSQDARLNQSLESRFSLRDYHVTFIDNVDRLAEPSAAAHDIFILCKVHDSTGPVFSQEAMKLNKLLFHKLENGESYLAVIPIEEQDGFRFNVHRSESDREPAYRFEEPLAVVRNAFAEFKSDNVGADLPEILNSLSERLRADPRAEPQKRARPSAEMLEEIIRQSGGNADLHFALAQAYEGRNQLRKALDQYCRAFDSAPHEERALNSIGNLLLTKSEARQLHTETLVSLLQVFERTPIESQTLDWYKNALLLAIGDEQSLLKAVDISKKYQGSAEFVQFYPAMIAAYASLVSKNKTPDSAQLYDSIEQFVQAMGKVDYMVEGQTDVGLRLVKKHTGRHTVFDIATSAHEGLAGQHTFVKAFTPRQRKSATIEFVNITSLNAKHGDIIKTPYAELHIPSYAVVAQKPNDETSAIYLVTPALPGKRADRFLETQEPKIRHAYLKRIMAAGIALQTSLRKTGCVFEPEPDFYVKRFEEKTLALLEEQEIFRVSEPQRKALIDFYGAQVHEPLQGVPKKLRLPYTGSHTLKNIVIDDNPLRPLDEQIKARTRSTQRSYDPAEQSVIGRCDIEDASNRFFVSDHALSIEDSAIGIEDAKLKDFYDRLLLLRLTAHKPKSQLEKFYNIDAMSATQRIKAIKRLLRDQKINCTYEEYHSLVARSSLERHLTFAMDRLKELMHVRDRLDEMERGDLRLKAYDTMLRGRIKDRGFSYEPIFDKLSHAQDAPPHERDRLFLYFSLHRDYETFIKSKDYHLSRVKMRMEQLWNGKTRDTGYAFFKNLVTAATNYAARK